MNFTKQIGKKTVCTRCRGALKTRVRMTATGTFYVLECAPCRITYAIKEALIDPGVHR